MLNCIYFNYCKYAKNSVYFILLPFQFPTDMNTFIIISSFFTAREHRRPYHSVISSNNPSKCIAFINALAFPHSGNNKFNASFTNAVLHF